MKGIATLRSTTARLAAGVAAVALLATPAYAALGRVSPRSTADVLLPPTLDTLNVLSTSLLPSLSSQDWINLAYARIVELGGSVTHVTHGYTVQSTDSLLARSPSNDSAEGAEFYDYIVALSPEEGRALSSAEATVRLGRGKTPLTRAILTLAPISHSSAAESSLFTIRIPTRLVPGHLTAVEAQRLADAESPAPLDPAGNPEKDDEANKLSISLALTLNHVTEALPKQVAQKGDQYLIWQGDVGVRSPYKTQGGRVKVKSPHPRLLSYDLVASNTTVPHTKDIDAKKSGATVTYGPYGEVPPLDVGLGGSLETVQFEVPQARVHFQMDLPVISIVQLDRHVEVSHWGDNLAVEDDIWMRNDGPKLKGHFSRIEHQQAAYFKQANNHILTNLMLHLPPGAKDPYFVDQIGNVSTSSFRPSAPSPSSLTTPAHLLPASRVSALEIRPRYPLLGGWNYTFTVGWNAELGRGGWGRKISSERFSVAVPFITPVTDVAVDSVRTRIVLPEGATDLTLSTPFPMDKITPETYTTYLDTRGRPSLLLEKSGCSEWCGRVVYLQYTVPLSAHYAKPITVFGVALGLLLVAGALGRFDSSIETKARKRQ